VFVAQRMAEAGTIDSTVAAAAVAATLGHMYPVFLRFRGGKGVSTAVGVLVALDPWLAAGAIATWIIIAFFFRYSSLAALVAAAFAPFFAFFLYGMGRFAPEPALGVTVISVLLVWRHRSNIRNLLAGTESRIGRGSAGSPQS
jgi:glycerol-3-phosphate acyltransferase PlsY